MTTESVTAYFVGEGRSAMVECIHRSMDWCLDDGIAALVIFTGTGEGPHHAAQRQLQDEKYRDLRIIAVAPPYGRPYRQNPGDPNSPLVRSGVIPAMQAELTELGVGVVSAHLPFKEMYTGRDRTSEWSRVAEAYGVLGGGFALCVQAVLVACDAGLVAHGERVVALSADTAFVASACRTESFLSPTEGLLVEHIICRPKRYDISKRIHETILPQQTELSTSQLSVPAPPSRQTPILAAGTEVTETPGRVRRKPATASRKKKQKTR